jgi:integrase/recombinase XerD
VPGYRDQGRAPGVPDPQRSDRDLWHREIIAHGKGRKVRTVRVSHDAACALDRYIRIRAGHAQA